MHKHEEIRKDVEKLIEGEFLALGYGIVKWDNKGLPIVDKIMQLLVKHEEEREEGLKQSIKLFYMDKPIGMTDYEFSELRGHDFVSLSKLVNWKPGEKPFIETKKEGEKE